MSPAAANPRQHSQIAARSVRSGQRRSDLRIFVRCNEDYEKLQELIEQQRVADEEKLALDEVPPGPDVSPFDIEAVGGDDRLPWW